MASSILENRIYAVVASDSHHDTEFISKLEGMYPNAYLYLHLGDSELPPEYISPFAGVIGNCDYYKYPEYKIIEFGKNRMYLFHGDSMRLTEDRLYYKAKENNCNIIIHGHTHSPYVKKVDDVYILCPGSIRYPRFEYPTYAIIDITNDELKIELKEYIR